MWTVFVWSMLCKLAKSNFLQFLIKNVSEAFVVSVNRPLEKNETLMQLPFGACRVTRTLDWKSMGVQNLVASITCVNKYMQ
jgi:hypothetical protein